MELVRRLEKVNQYDIAIAGGKGANLGELTKAGQLVPPGFVLLTSAYQLFVKANGIQSEIARLAASVLPGNFASAEQASLAIRALFENGNIPDEIVQAIQNAYQQLGEQAVAIRSSATVEDLPRASFAGQHESYLNIHGEVEVLYAVKRCWSSLWTERALTYRAQRGIDPQRVSLAVVVQQMLPARVSGVLFTVNPVTSDESEVVINAAWGLGEAIVSGRVNPDTIRVEKVTGLVKQVEIGRKAVMTIAIPQAVADTFVDLPERKQEVLIPDQISELTRIGREIEILFGKPQDIEWAIAAGKTYVLQARPVTGLPARPLPSMKQPLAPGDDTWDSESIQPAQPFDLWTRTNVGENLPFPITPLTATGFPALFKLDEQTANSGGTATQGARRFYGRLYINEGAILHNFSQEYGIPASFIDRMWGSRRRGKQRERGKFRPLRLLRKLPSLLSQGFNATRQKGPKQTPQQFFAQIDQWVNKFLQLDLSSLDDRELWAKGLPIWRERGAQVFATNIRISTPAALFYAPLERIVGRWTGHKETAHDLVTGLSGIYSAEIGPDLWGMAQTLRELGLDNLVLDNDPAQALALLRDTSEANLFLEQFDSFLQRHGHRCPNEVEFLNPRWIEAPEQVIELIANYLRAGNSVNPIAAETRQRQRRIEAVVSVARKIGPLRRVIFLSILRRAQKALPIRDNSRYFVTKFIFPMRKMFAELGRRWAERGWLSRPDDIFFLTLSEVQKIVEAGTPSVVSKDLHTLVKNRRIAYEYWMTVAPPDTIGPDGTPIVEEEGDRNVLEGTAVSGGRVRGIARIVLDPREAATLRTGEILVTQATDPGWTPVFPLVSGLVLEIGGQLSHGAIVAREYGIPAVVNVPSATRRIEDGQTIVVDGTNGRVYMDGVKG